MEEWTGTYWRKISLRDLGLVFQLGHDGGTCPSPAEGTRKLVLGDVTGIHEVAVRFCECLDDEEQFTYQWVQVFRQGWFPATIDKPATAFTFRMLDAFQELNFQGKTSLYDYWKSLERITDNTGSRTGLNRYRQVVHVVRLWRHLVSLKRAARAHDPAGAAATKEGELALDCPACPHPGKNLPQGWEEAPPHIKWLYTLFLMLDANFKAKLKDRGLEDIELAPGWMYYVENTKFKAHVDSLGPQNERNGCSAEHKAIQNANMRKEGYIASGVGAVLCARHAIVRKNGIGDLPNGEKFSIMDYLLFNTILGLTLLFLISYDIACQWHKKLARRALEDLPEHLRTDISKLSIRYAIPKKHIRVHGADHSRWSFNFIRWVGRTYAEGIESLWAHANPVSLSAREMGPGMRREHLNDHWGGWNWQKILGFAAYLLRLLQEAYAMREKHRKAHRELSSTFPADTIRKWEDEIKLWDEDPSQVDDPYEEKRTTATLKNTRLQIADEEAQELAAGTLPLTDVSPGVFIQVGLELEEQQRVLRARNSNSSASDGSKAETQEKRNALRRRIDSWQGTQNIVMPIVPQFRTVGNPSALAAALMTVATAASTTISTGITSSAAAGGTHTPGDGQPAALASENSTTPLEALLRNAGVQAHSSGGRQKRASSSGQSESEAPAKAEDVPLWLPSSLPPILRASLAPGLADKERRLRIAQADDALEDIRRLRRIITGIADFKRLNVAGAGQRSTGRVRTLFTKFQHKIDRAADRYRAARAALEQLDANGDWRGRFKELRKTDLRGPGRDDAQHTSEGRYEISWIWLVPRGLDLTLPEGVDGELDPQEFLDNMKIEWARSRARAERWGEEVLLLEEEMRRVIEYFEWKAKWWRENVGRRSEIAGPLRRGLGAYAEKQAAIFEGLAYQCAARWVPFFRTQRPNDLPEWSTRYNIPVKTGKQGSHDFEPRAPTSSETRPGASGSTTVVNDPVNSSSDSESSDSEDSDQSENNT
ncbi:hypothetical protein K466DRAFT_667830 [Polyporus arcularius HHB13444]|uniref:CxC2-like cysteine cluster KDZ transposase-associated domain-containing protein n=1 Tax=Polyporus arcularius HHB13444 TaxID=1314778 RepID=A0A5C3NU49_9APHY|nr:hypothetical protein K466DRAFT_667830 [Polyporus arcularius HHB13444]